MPDMLFFLDWTHKHTHARTRTRTRTHTFAWKIGPWAGDGALLFPLLLSPISVRSSSLLQQLTPDKAVDPDGLSLVRRSALVYGSNMASQHALQDPIQRQA